MNVFIVTEDHWYRGVGDLAGVFKSKGEAKRWIIQSPIPERGRYFVFKATVGEPTSIEQVLSYEEGAFHGPSPKRI